MRALVLHRYKAAPRIEEVPAPQPGPGDLLIQVHGASVNPVDLKIRDGGVKVLVPYRPPFVMGNDLSGVVLKVGAGVTRFREGDAVYARLDKDRIGAFAEQALVRESAAALKPNRLSHVEAASIPLVGLTAWQTLVDVAHLQAGQSVLIHAGSGGLGTFAIQLARHLGARVATTVSARNEPLVRELGAGEVIDYRATRFEDVLRDVDVVLDTQGGETLERSFLVVRRGGVVVSVNSIPDARFARAYGLNPFLVAGMAFLSRKITRAARQREARFEFVFMKANGEQLQKITALLDEGKIRPVIDRIFPFDQALDALAYNEAGRSVGKIVVQMRP